MTTSSKFYQAISKIWEFCLDLVFPRQGVASLVSIKDQAELNTKDAINVSQHYDFWDKVQVITATDYDLIKPVLYRFKYHFERYLGDDLGYILYQKIQKLICQTSLSLPDFITFVPGDPKRIAIRGFNSPEILAKYLSIKFKIPIYTLFIKQKHTKAQAGLSRADRLKNLDQVFNLNFSNLSPPILTQTTRIWLIDDVIASGSTVKQLIDILHADYPNIKVTVVVLARNGESSHL